MESSKFLRILEKPRLRALAFAVGVFCASLTGCAPYGKVSERRISAAPLPPGLGALVEVERGIAEGLRRAGQDPHAALGHYVEALKATAVALARSPHDETARRDYNFALARVFTTIRQAKLDAWSKPMALPGGYVITHPHDPRPDWNPGLYEFIPADEIECSGAYITERNTKPGLGTPVVAVRKEARPEFEAAFLASPKIYHGMTAIARFEDNRCVISFQDPLSVENVTFAGHRFPLAADYTVSLAMVLAREKPEKLEVSRLFFPEKYAKTARVARLEPYDPNKIPVLIVHGLMGSPATWVPMLNTLRADPFIRKNYQFWYFSYPSGYPIPYSLMLMRHQMDAIEKVYQPKKKLVVIGHSMGAVISRLAVSDSGMKIWNSTFSKPPRHLGLSAESETLLQDALIFRHRPEVGRAVFIAGPHRGSDLAINWFARLGSRLVRAPQTLTQLAHQVKNLVTLDTTALKFNHAPNSVDTLAPNNRFVRAASDLPIPSRIPYHSIVGDRGRGDTPNSSDGVVPYWSSHMAGAASERIVPSNHNVHKHPEGIEEVRRLLYLHAGSVLKKKSP